MAYHSIPTEQIIECVRHAIHFSAPKSASIAEDVQMGECYSTLAFAVIGDLFAGHLVFGDHDTFTVNDRELESYLMVFDEMHVVCGQKHLRQVRRLFSGAWAIWCANHMLNGDVTVVIEQRGERRIPEDPHCIRARRGKTNRLNTASLLSHEHAVAALGAVDKGLGRAEAIDLVADTFTLDEIRDLVKASFALRYPPRGKKNWLLQA